METKTNPTKQTDKRQIADTSTNNIFKDIEDAHQARMLAETATQQEPSLCLSETVPFISTETQVALCESQSQPSQLPKLSANEAMAKPHVLQATTVDEDNVPQLALEVPDNGSLQEPTATGKESNVLSVCCSCREEVPIGETVCVQKANPITGAVSQRRCRRCNAFRSRLTRMTKNNETAKVGFQNLNTEERTAFYKTCKDLCGPTLTKRLMESITTSSNFKNTMLHNCAGEFQDYDVLEEKYKEKPIEWENIKANSVEAIHPTRLVKQLWMPTLTLSMTREQVHLTEAKRKLDSEKVIKPDKKPKTIADAQHSWDQAAGVDVAHQGKGPKKCIKGEAVKKSIGEGQKKRLNTLIEKLETDQLSLQQSKLDLDAPGADKLVPTRYKDKLNNALDTTSKHINLAKEYLQAGEADAGAVKDWFGEVKPILDSNESIRGKIEMLLDENDD